MFDYTKKSYCGKNKWQESILDPIALCYIQLATIHVNSNGVGGNSSLLGEVLST